METLKKLLHKDRCLPVLGPCMIIFAIPLLIPGLTLTCVAFNDETGFPKFGGLHVLGIILLVVSGLLFIVGGVLSCFFNDKVKGRVSPHDEEDCLSTTSSLEYEIVGHKHSTHTSKHPDGPIGVEQDERALSPSRIKETGNGHSSQSSLSKIKEAKNGHSPRSSPSTTSCSSFQRQVAPTRGHTSQCAAAAASAASVTTAPAIRREVTKNVSGDTLQVESLGRPGLSSPRQRGLNFMSSDSEDEETTAAIYSLAAGKLLQDRRNQKAAMSTASASSSSSSSSEHSTSELSEAEGDPSSSGYRQRQSVDQQAEPSVLAQRTVQSEQKHDGNERNATSASSVESSPEKSSAENDSSETAYALHRQTVNAQTEKETTIDAQPLFVTRKQSWDQRHCYQHRVTESERRPELGNADLQRTEFQNNSSSTVATESPSHGTYSVNSFVSDDLHNAKTFSDVEVAEEEEELYIPSHLSPGQRSLESSRSPSPVPLKRDVSRNWGGDSSQCVTVLANKSSFSEHSSPSKQSPSGTVCFDFQVKSVSGFVAENEPNPERKKKKKRKKKKRRKEKDNAETTEGSQLTDNNVAVENQQHSLSPNRSFASSPVSPYRSSMKPSADIPNRFQSPRHVHWSDDEETN